MLWIESAYINQELEKKNSFMRNSDRKVALA